MLRAMTGVSEPFMEALLDGYDGGFDVGGVPRDDHAEGRHHQGGTQLRPARRRRRPSPVSHTSSRLLSVRDWVSGFVDPAPISMHL
uniref:Uncharacterized protein n=1 Tax=Arundo donax TaxID=35708 RepID=A0A0A9DUE0_ARUDO